MTQFGRSLARVLSADVVATMGVRLLVVAGGFASSVMTARWLSPSGRGEYFLLITLALTVAQFGNLGLQSSNTYFVAQSRRMAGPLLVNSLWIALIAGGGGGALALALNATIRSGGRASVWLVPVLAAATLFYMLATNILIGLQQTRRFNLFQLLGNYGVLACLLVAAAMGAGPSGFVAASAIGWCAIGALLFVTLRRDAPAPLRFDGGSLRLGIGYALKAYVATLAGFLAIRVNVFLLGSWVASEQLGHYSVASQMADVMGIVPQSMALLLFPALVADADGRFASMLRHLGAAALLLGGACLAALLAAEPFVAIVFGPAFVEAASLLRWMLPGVFFLGLTSVVSQYLAASGFPVALVAIWVAGAAASLVAGMALIPAWSAHGAAAAFSISHALIFAAVSGLSLVVSRSNRRVAPRVLEAEGAVC